MKKVKHTAVGSLTIIFLIIVIIRCAARKSEQDPRAIISDHAGMPVYVIERELPGAGKLNQQELKAMSVRSFEVLRKMICIKWMYSYVTDNKMYCVYSTLDTSAIIEHGKDGGFPVNRISKVQHMISSFTTNMDVKN